MIEEKIQSFVREICEYNDFDKTQEEQINYVLKVIIYEIIKFILIIFIFSVFGYFKESILILGVMVVTKPFIGGYHEETQVKCFLATILLVLFIVYLSVNIKLDFISNIILSLISIFAIYNQAPIINPKMPLNKEKLIIRNRRIAIINTIIISSVSLMVIGLGIYSELLVWSISVQAILMFNKKD